MGKIDEIRIKADRYRSMALGIKNAATDGDEANRIISELGCVDKMWDIVDDLLDEMEGYKTLIEHHKDDHHGKNNQPAT